MAATSTEASPPAAGLPPAEIEAVRAACARFGNDPHRMMDILHAVQARLRWIPPGAMETIATATGLTRVAVEGVASFYAFFALEPKGRVTIRLCDDIIDRFAGMPAVKAAFEEALGVTVGGTTACGQVSLEETPCIGLCDQAPAAMLGNVVLTRLTPDRAREVAAALLSGARAEELVCDGFDALAPHAQALRQVENNVRVAGPSLLSQVPAEAGLRRAVGQPPDAILDAVEASGLRGCGGAGFGTGRKWRMAAGTESPRRVIICNADEGEPGTFKDRVLLTERPHLLIEGMTIAARAVGASEGILYLRGEYAYLRPLIDEVLEDRRARGLLGQTILGTEGFDFDIRIQMGAGAYICGEEGALISSCEGLPGEPKTRPPFPVTHGYLGLPTVVNNVETFCHVARILDRGADWFRAMGTGGSHGTKLFSVSGDCARPGIYELPYGHSVAELLEMSGGEGAAAVLVGGPSGTMIGRDAFDRRLCFDDLATGGAVIVFDGTRNILEVVDYYMSFFVHESCGYCTPCRVGNVFLQKAIAKLRRGLASPADIDYLRDLSATIIETSRCGLGTTSPNPILSTLENFPLVYAAMVKPNPDRLRASFDIQSAIEGARKIAHRRSYIYDRDFSE